MPFCLACEPGPLAANRLYVVGAAPTRSPHLGSQAAPGFSRPLRLPGGRASHPPRFVGASWRTADLVDDDRDQAAQAPLVEVVFDARDRCPDSRGVAHDTPGWPRRTADGGLRAWGARRRQLGALLTTSCTYYMVRPRSARLIGAGGLQLMPAPPSSRFA